MFDRDCWTGNRCIPRLPIPVLVVLRVDLASLAHSLRLIGGRPFRRGANRSRTLAQTAHRSGPYVAICRCPPPPSRCRRKFVRLILYVQRNLSAINIMSSGLPDFSFSNGLIGLNSFLVTFLTRVFLPFIYQPVDLFQNAT